ncbi:helix-turn-helix domain-containing protein [Pseudonocardia alni]|uniref:helix-turn-helix domain-containing protein n=1 Tax=Pseudonocardia alni TaxID=33907 RepID=UPI0033D021B4
MPGTGAGPGGGVQSVVRAFRILDVLAEADGELSISELAVAVDLPQPTIHRIVATLRELGHAHQVTNRRYTLGPRLIGLGDRASRVLGVRAGVSSPAALSVSGPIHRFGHDRVAEAAALLRAAADGIGGTLA